MKTIVFISELAMDIQQQWLVLLSNALTNETILLPEQIDASQINNVDIAIIANPDPKTLAKFPNLIWIQSLWAGVEKLANENLNKNVKLVRLIDPQLAITMAESVLAWTLYLQRNMAEYAQQQKQKQWQQLPTTNAKDIRIGILGAGTLGLAALETLKKFDYQLSCWTRTPKQLDGVKNHTDLEGLQTMLATTDILINLLPLTKQTHQLLNKKRLSLLPVGAKLINFSRGAIIDTQSLLELLENRHISHAVLDVFEQEPLPKEDSIWSNPHITVLPHISAPTHMTSATYIVAKNIQEYRLNKNIPKSVDKGIGY